MKGWDCGDITRLPRIHSKIILVLILSIDWGLDALFPRVIMFEQDRTEMKGLKNHGVVCTGYERCFSRAPKKNPMSIGDATSPNVERPNSGFQRLSS